jgi:predicted nucleic acid-binding protein
MTGDSELYNAIVFDTDILIDAAKGIETAVNLISSNIGSTRLSVSIITKLELVVGCRNKRELRETNKFIRQFDVLPISEVASKVADDLLQKYRLSHGLLIPDALIAATAISVGYPLISKNQRDYRFISELDLIEYPP